VKLLALHGFCVGNGVNVERGQIYAPASIHTGQYDVVMGRAVVVADSTAVTSVGATIVSTPSFNTNNHPAILLDPTGIIDAEVLA